MDPPGPAPPHPLSPPRPSPFFFPPFFPPRLGLWVEVGNPPRPTPPPVPIPGLFFVPRPAPGHPPSNGKVFCVPTSGVHKPPFWVGRPFLENPWFFVPPPSSRFRPAPPLLEAWSNVHGWTPPPPPPPSAPPPLPPRKPGCWGATPFHPPSLCAALNRFFFSKQSAVALGLGVLSRR